MKTTGRAQRPQPTRQTSNRQPQFQTSAAGSTAGTTQSQTASGGKTIEQVVTETVRKGYEVVEENLRQGRQAAHRMRRGTYESSEIPAELGRFANRLLQLGMELGTTWVQLIAAVLRDPQLRFAFEEASQEAPRTAAAVQPFSPPIAYRIRCSREVEHSLILHPLQRPTVSAVAGLHSIETRASIPADRVTLRREGNSLAVHINVPEDAPAGTYVGTVIDRETHEPIGTLRLRIVA